MTVGELKKFLEGVKDDSLSVSYLPPDSSLKDDYLIKGALLVDKVTEENELLRGVYLLEAD